MSSGSPSIRTNTAARVFEDCQLARAVACEALRLGIAPRVRRFALASRLLLFFLYVCGLAPDTHWHTWLANPDRPSGPRYQLDERKESDQL